MKETMKKIDESISRLAVSNEDVEETARQLAEHREAGGRGHLPPQNSTEKKEQKESE